MALVLADRVRETTTTAGTGTITLLGAVPSCQSFAVIGNGNTTYYTIVAYTGTEYEVGIGTYTASGALLSRDTVLASSNGGSLVNFSIGTKDVFVDYPAGRAVYENETGNVDGYPITGGTINNTVIGGTTPAAGTFTTLTATGQTSLGGVAGSESFRVTTPISAPNAYVKVFGSPFGFGYLSTDGSATSSGLLFSSKGGAEVSTYTNAFGQKQFSVTHTTSAVNNLQVTGAATGSGPVLSAQGSDTNIDINYTTKGTGSHKFNTGTGEMVRVADSSGTGFVQLSGGTTPYIVAQGSTNANLSLGSNGTGTIFVRTNGGGTTQAAISHTASAVNYVQVTGATTTTNPVITGQGSDSEVGLDLGIRTGGFNFIRQRIGSTGIIDLSLNAAGSPALKTSITSSQVNYHQLTGSATGSGPIHSVAGSDTNIDLNLTPKGTGSVINNVNGGTFSIARDSASNAIKLTAPNQNLYVQSSGGGVILFNTSDGTTLNQMRITSTASVVNYLNVTGGATGVAPVVSALGSDTNIPLVLQPKGTGALQAQQTDSTATGGNARGVNAVDWQTLRASASSVASGAYSVVGGGYNNSASGFTANIAGGYANTSNNFTSFVGGGQSNTASNQGASISGGASNTASNWMSALVGGYGNTAAGAFNFIGGGQANSGTALAAVTTQSGTMNATTAVTLSGSNASIKVGQYITGTSIATNTYVAAVSGTSLTLSQVASGSSTSTLSFFTPHGVVVGGGNNQATGSYSFIGGGGNAGTASQRNVASGDWSFIGGGINGLASGQYAFVGGGSGSIASGTYSVVSGGVNNQATSFGATSIGGYNNIANSAYSATLGGNFASTRGIEGISVFGSQTPLGGTLALAQSSLLVLAVQTTDATATVLRSNASAASTNNQIILPNNSAYAFKGSVIANVTGAANGASWSFEGAIMRGANAASTVLIGTPAINRVAATAGATAWVIALTADTTNGGLAVTVTGAASTTIRWVCKAETTETTF